MNQLVSFLWSPLPVIRFLMQYDHLMKLLILFINVVLVSKGLKVVDRLADLRISRVRWDKLPC
jgi:hypothetical protein